MIDKVKGVLSKKDICKYIVISLTGWLIIQLTFTFFILKNNINNMLEIAFKNNGKEIFNYIENSNTQVNNIVDKIRDDKDLVNKLKNGETNDLAEIFSQWNDFSIQWNDFLIVVADNNFNIIYKQKVENVSYYHSLDKESGFINNENNLTYFVNVPIISENEKLGTVMIGYTFTRDAIKDLIISDIIEKPFNKELYGMTLKYAIGTFIIAAIIFGSVLYIINKNTIGKLKKIDSKLRDIRLIEDEEVIQNKETDNKETTVDSIVSSLESYYKMINYINKFDEVTKLYKKDYFLNEIEKMLHGSEGAFLYLNIDGFSAINNSYGSQTGDEILSIVGERLKYNLPNNIYYISRLMGDEFGIFIRADNDKKKIAEKCQKILNLINRPIIIQGRVHVITSTIGISIYKEDAQNLGELMENSYLAMTNIKKQRKNSYKFFEESLRNNVSLEMIQKGLENNEFTLYYQPQLNATKEKIIAVEALARWIHPERGIISPIKFIPLAEETGYILTLGTWILNRACRDIRDINKRLGINLKVAINISSIQFMQDNFEEVVKEALEKSGLDATLLELEITESIAMDSSQLIIEKINNLKKLGVTISLDDFGTGYSSLKYLHAFRIDTLKIDKSFVDNMFVDNGIIRSIINIAHNLDATVVAEGVELEDQVEELKKLNCDILQGYYISKPLEKSKLEEFLSE